MENNKSKGINLWSVDILIESILVYLLVSLGLLLEIYNRGLIFQNGILDSEIIKIIFSRSAEITIIFVVTYGVIKSAFSRFYYVAESEIIGENTNGRNIISILSDSFIILATLLSTMAIRPIVQETFKESNVPDFNYVFVRYDAIPSVILLLLIAFPLLFFVLKRMEGKRRLIQSFLIAIVIIGVGIINSSSNFGANISESRASWVTQDWSKQETDAQASLKDALTDEEKAASYYWLGVSENRQGNYEKAIEYQLNATKLNPTYGAAYASLANAYIETKEYSKALEGANKCIEYDPTYAWCYQALGNYYWATGDIKTAGLNLCKASIMDPKNKELSDQCKNLQKDQ